MLSTGKKKLINLFFLIAELKKYENFQDYSMLDGEMVCEINPFLSKYYQSMNV